MIDQRNSIRTENNSKQKYHDDKQCKEPRKQNKTKITQLRLKQKGGLEGKPLGKTTNKKQTTNQKINKNLERLSGEFSIVEISIVRHFKEMLTYWEELSASALKSEQKREITNYLGNQSYI